MRLVDADDLYRKVVGYNGGAVDKTVAKRLIEQQPTVDNFKPIANITIDSEFIKSAVDNAIATQSNASNTLNALDTIYRQAALDRFEPWLKVKGYSEGELNMLKAVLYELRCLPSAQPEITRCKDCKHRNTDECPMYYEEWIEYDEGDGFIERDFIPQDRTVGDGFCFKGERREE